MNKTNKNFRKTSQQNIQYSLWLWSTNSKGCSIPDQPAQSSQAHDELKCLVTNVTRTYKTYRFRHGRKDGIGNNSRYLHAEKMFWRLQGLPKRTDTCWRMLLPSRFLHSPTIHDLTCTDHQSKDVSNVLKLGWDEKLRCWAIRVMTYDQRSLNFS